METQTGTNQAETVQALVIGGSIAGLLAARVLAGYFPRVTVVERDHLPEGPEPRPGVPQARHIHLLLWPGQQWLEKLFPGLQDELGQAGAPLVDWIGDGCWFMFGGWGPRFPSDYLTHTCSRDLLEWSIRRRLLATPQVRFREGWEVVDLLSNQVKSRVTGVRLRSRDHAERGAEELQADLVVDASGRESRTPGWLESLGYPAPHDTVVNSFLGYASRVYQRPPAFTDWKSLLVRGTPPANKRGGAINPIEGERWMVTLAGAGRDYPPTDEAGFLEFARSLPVPTLYEAISKAHPLTPISGYRKTENRWRHYERMPHRPENLVVTGDAVCAFNPVYAQGMTVAALGALALGECLRERGVGKSSDAARLDGLARDVQAQLARVISGPWLLATGDDFRYPETEGGRRNTATRLAHRYMDRVMSTALQDPLVFQTFFEVAHLLKPVSAFFRPAILARTLAGSPRRK